MLEFNFSPFPILETERLILRQLEVRDAPEMLIYRSDEDVMRYIPRPRATSEQDAVDLINWINSFTEKNEAINWGITLKGKDQVLGSIGFVRMNKENHRAELGYLLGKAYQRQGIMHEAIQCVVRYGFDRIKLHSIEAIVDPRNTASIGVLEKSNFKKEAHFREDFFYEGEFLDSMVYSKLIHDTH